VSSGTLLSIPTYADLLRRTDGPAGSCWGVFGADDEIGAVNFLTEERVLAATHVVRRGTTFNLDYPVNHFNPPPSKFRTPARHTIFEYRPHHNDDFVDGFFLQGTSQIDGFRHVAHHEHGYYNRAPKDRLVAGDPTIGVNRWAEHGIVGRGVLLDVARYVAAKGRPLDHGASEQIGPGLLEEVARAQGVELRSGDLLLVRTDWPSHFFKMASTDFEVARHEAGLEQSREMLAWLWDHQIPLVASDNFALEAYPDHPDSPFVERFGEEEIDGMIHPYLIAMLGMVIGELWKLEDLAEDCAGDGIYESLLVCKPMNLIGAVGSPANAVAIK
jgi:kynurenine formamidase